MTPHNLDEYAKCSPSEHPSDIYINDFDWLRACIRSTRISPTFDSQMHVSTPDSTCVFVCVLFHVAFRSRSWTASRIAINSNTHKWCGSILSSRKTCWLRSRQSVWAGSVKQARDGVASNWFKVIVVFRAVWIPHPFGQLINIKRNETPHPNTLHLRVIIGIDGAHSVKCRLIKHFTCLPIYALSYATRQYIYVWPRDIAQNHHYDRRPTGDTELFSLGAVWPLLVSVLIHRRLCINFLHLCYFGSCEINIFAQDQFISGTSNGCSLVSRWLRASMGGHSLCERHFSPIKCPMNSHLVRHRHFNVMKRTIEYVSANLISTIRALTFERTTDVSRVFCAGVVRQFHDVIMNR